MSKLLAFRANVQQWMFEQITLRKLNSPLGYALAVLVAIFVGSAWALGGAVLGIASLGVFLAIPMVVMCMFFTNIGMGVMLGMGFLVVAAVKYSDAPLGTSLDGLLLLMLAGMLVIQTRKHNWAFVKDPISTWLLIWIYYNVFQILNPWAQSSMAWLYTVRSVALLNVLYYIACFAFSSLKNIKNIMKWIVILTTITMIYGYFQEFNGMNAFERQWLYSDKERAQLYMQWGRLRVFSLLSDPMTFGIMMCYMGAFCIVMSTAPIKIWKRISLAIVGALMLVVTAFTGTRTCYVLIPAGFIFYAFMTMSRRVWIFIAFFMMVGTVLVLKSTSNPIIYRIQSAFKPNKDASAQLRYFNQKRIRPYIYERPIGSGLGSTGLWAQRFTPNTFLASFAHDSYYVRLAVETGWIGLIIYMIFAFILMQRAVFFYNRVRDPIIKHLYLGLITALFILFLANYPQEAIVQLPTSMMVYVFFAALVRLKDFDPHYQEITQKIKDLKS